ncbi:LOW QUALITY PROTEIN: hypothetical protein V2J09_012083, partial [Rumex salicifolius]
ISNLIPSSSLCRTRIPHPSILNFSILSPVCATSTEPPPTPRRRRSSTLPRSTARRAAAVRTARNQKRRRQTLPRFTARRAAAAVPRRPPDSPSVHRKTSTTWRLKTSTTWAEDEHHPSRRPPDSPSVHRKASNSSTSRCPPEEKTTRRGIMEVDGENPASTSALTAATEPSPSADDVQAANSAVTLVQPIVPPLIPPPIILTIAPIPAIPPLPPLAPLPIRPPVLRPPGVQNGEVRASESDSDDNESGSTRANRATSLEYEITEESRQVRERHEKAMQDFMLKRRAAALAVPTNDMSVRARLRRLGEPITLFGEKEMERRDRLRMLMAKLDAEGQLEKLMKAHEDEEAASAGRDQVEEETIQYPFYTEGSNALLEARLDIAKFSLFRSAQRLNRARRKREDPDEDMDAEIGWALDQAKMRLEMTVHFQDVPFQKMEAFLQPVAKIWSMPEVKKISVLKGHTERATDVAFSPVNDIVATASADRTAKLWNTEGSLLKTFEGHLQRLARIAFHPSGKYLGTASFDKTWRLWDVESGTELLLQEGHSRSVYAVAFHPDGSLAASTGLDALARVWDLRTGRSILSLEGHVKHVLGVSFSPNGYHLATGSEDNTCRIWDMRKRKCIYIIPAHSNLISQVKFEPQEGYHLVTASYDTTAKVWSSRDFKPIRTLSGHEDKVSSLDIMADGQQIVTVSHDRTIKLWSQRKQDPEKDMDFTILKIL